MSRVVAICDNTELFREGVVGVLSKSKFDVALSIRSLDEIDGIETQKGVFDVMILGINDDLFEDDFRHAALSAATTPPIVVLATSPSRALIRAAMAAGFYAVLSKTISGEALSCSLELVLLGHRFFPAHDSEVGDESAVARDVGARNIVGKVDRRQSSPPHLSDENNLELSEREEQILSQLIAGASNKAIARGLVIAEATVKVHIKGLLRKLRVSNRTQAAIWGVKHGFGERARAATTRVRSPNCTFAQNLRNAEEDPRGSL